MLSQLIRIGMLLGMGMFGAWCQAADEYRYTLGAGDTVKITVFEYPEMTTEARVTEAGKISFPLLGVISVAGLTTTEAEQSLETRLRQGGFVKAPHVNLVVEKYASQAVSVVGEVSKPGRYPVEASSTVLDMIAVAGGLSNSGSVPGSETVTVIRQEEGKPVKHEVDLSAVAQGDTQQNLAVSNGDIIYVPKAPTFYIYGEVNKPGVYPLEHNMRVMQALSVGGGLTVRGSQRGLKINRNDGKGAVQARDASLTDALQSDDVIYVSESWF